MDWSAEQLAELSHAAHCEAKAHVRTKALAVLAVAKGKTQALVAEFYDTSPNSVNSWVAKYRTEGLAGFEIAAGRGRHRKADDQEVMTYVLQSPRNFGVDRSRWTLQLLADTVPSLQGFTETGVRHALARLGLSYKRGQPWLLSPDPDFGKKRLLIGAALEHAEAHPGAVVALFQDEASFYRQPTQASLWAPMGRAQPHMLWSPRSNTWVRVAATLDAVSGQTYYRQASKITVPQLIKSYQQVLDAYPQALMIYLIQDNWPVHKHPTVMAFLARHPRLQVLFLPTYAPRLNPIEKLWRWAKQTLCHAHPFCDNFTEFKGQLSACLDNAATMPAYIKHYCGLSSFNLFM